MKLCIDPGGRITALYQDSLLALGEVREVTRASHVEWRADGWYVRLSNDPRNGADAGRVICEGLATRAEAIAQEQKWLEEHKI